MLKEFRVKNFKSFCDEIVLKFDNTREYNFNQKLIKNGLINKAVLYGANGSGKSNLGYALMDITTHLFDKGFAPYIDPYLNLDSAEDFVSFTYIFLFNGKNVEYNYKKDANKQLIFEELKEDGNLLFQYNYNTFKSINNIEEAKTLNLNFENINKISILKYIYNNSNLSEDSSISRLFNFVNNMLWFRSIRNIEFMNCSLTGENICTYIIKENLVQELEDFLHNCGLYYKLTILKTLNQEFICVKFNNGEVPLEQVSSTGTISLVAFFYYMHKIDTISFLFIDEFDAFYHYDLAKSILDLINSRQEFQSIITTHNPFLVGNDIMRPDCYLQIKNSKIKSFADSTNRTIRQAHNLEKMMISNEFEN